MLSLYLKILEGETQASVAMQQKLFPDEPLLPDLSKNIRIGNSLIESDYLDLFPDADEQQKVLPFDWDTQFANILAAGGFDAVIGNPPYACWPTTWGICGGGWRCPSESRTGR